MRKLLAPLLVALALVLEISNGDTVTVRANCVNAG